MKPKTQITPPDWMTAPQTVAVMAALNDPGDKQTLFVGGCVRNALLNLPVSDIDLATSYTPVEVIQRLQHADIHYAPTGIKHGTITAITQGRTFEITTLRLDVETDGRHATVAFTRNWIEDAGRRDFTINTLLADDTGNIYDPLGRGIADLEAGRVMFVGNPFDRIAEDYLRILRFFRFHALYGRGKPDTQALEACNQAAPNIIHLSRERLAQEMMRILSIDDPTNILLLMFENHVAVEFRNQNFDRHTFSIFCRMQREYKAVDIMARLAMLANMDYDRAGMLMKLSGAQLKFVRALVLLTRDNNMPLNDKSVCRLIYSHDRDVVKQFLLLHMARDSETPELRKLFHIAKTWNPPKFPLAGQDAIKIGITPGPLMGQMLTSVEEWWVEQNFEPNPAACLEQMRKLFQHFQTNQDIS